MVGAVLALAGVLAELPASGTPLPDDAVPLTLSWTAPEGCPDAAEVRRQVFEMVHASGASTSSTSGSGARARYEPIDARGVVRRNADGTWNLELETSVGGLTGTRTLSGSGCDELARAGALVLALTINAAPNGEEAAPPAAIQAKPVAPVRETIRTQLPERSGARVRFAAAIDALLSAGQLPKVAEGAGLRLEAEIGHLLLQVHGATWLPQTSSIPSDSTVGGRFEFDDVGAAACGLADLRYGFAVELCAGAAEAWVRGTGFGTASPSQSPSGWWSVVMGSAGVRYRIAPRLAARLAAEVWTFPFGRPTFALHDTGKVFELGEVSGRIALGLQFYL